MIALVIDDSRAMRMILKKTLLGLGVTEVREAGDGKQGLDSLSNEGRPDVVLVDWNMPVMNGLDFIKQTRSQPTYGDLKILMVTTESEMESVVTALEAGANEYLMKPFTSQMVQDKLQILGLGTEG